MRGRKPKPTQIKKLQGNAGKRKLNKAEPQFETPAGVPQPPEWLGEAGRACWGRVLAVLHPARLATGGDLEALAKYCDVFAQWWDAREFIAKHGQTYPLRDEKGNVRCVQQFPQVSIYRNLLAVMQKYEVEFGMTPSSRSRISLPGGDEAAADPMEDFLRGYDGRLN